MTATPEILTIIQKQTGDKCQVLPRGNIGCSMIFSLIRIFNLQNINTPGIRIGREAGCSDHQSILTYFGQI